MSRQKLVLRVILGSLALAAGAGVLGVLFTGADWLVRICLTALATAAAATLVYPFSALLDRERWGRSGAAGCLLVILEYLTTLFYIWVEWAMTLRQEKNLGGSMGLLGATGLATVLFLGMAQARRTRWAGRLGLSVATAVTVTGLLGFWVSRPYGELLNPWLPTSIFIAIYGPLAVCSMIGIGDEAGRPWRWPGVLAAAVACGVLIADVWFDLDGGPEFITVVSSIAIAVAHANLLVRVRLPEAGRWLVPGSIGAVAIAALLLDVLVVLDSSEGHLLWRGAASAGILAACGTTASAVLGAVYRFGTRPPRDPAADRPLAAVTLDSVTLSCPRCGWRQDLPLGGARCARCELAIAVHIDDGTAASGPAHAD